MNLIKTTIYLLTVLLLGNISNIVFANENVLFTERWDFVPSEKDKIIKKHLLIEPDIKAEYYYYSSRGASENIFILFHDDISSAEEFMQNTSLHRRIISMDSDFILFSSYNGEEWQKNKEINEKIITLVLREAQLNRYGKVFLLGYAEGGTFASDLYCNNYADNRNIARVDYIWNINGTVNKDCNLPNRLSYNLFYGEHMDLNYYSNDYYNNYDDVINFLASREKCKIEDNLVEHGSSFDETYLERVNFSCENENNVNVFKAINMERNFPYTNKLELDGFIGNELNSFDLINFIRRIHYF